LLFLIASRFAASGLLADDAMNFIGTLVQILKRKHYTTPKEDPEQ
jgi:type I restriction enzyme, R subunit